MLSNCVSNLEFLKISVAFKMFKGYWRAADDYWQTAAGGFWKRVYGVWVEERVALDTT